MENDYTDTCGWCGQGTSNLQISGDVGLCPSCCPGVMTKRLTVISLIEENDLPPQWHFMSLEEEYQYVEHDMPVGEIADKYDWDKPPGHFHKEGGD